MGEKHGLPGALGPPVGDRSRCSATPSWLRSTPAGGQPDANRWQVRSARQCACAKLRRTRPQPRPSLPGGIPPSWAGKQLFASWWSVPLETVPRGLFSPPTPGRTVINTATNAHDANWQRECNTSPAAPTELGQLLAFLPCLPIWSVLVPHSSNWSVS